MRKAWILLLAVLCSVFAVSCGSENLDDENIYQVYYLNNGETKVEMHPYRMTATDEEAQIKELLSCLTTNPDKLEYKAPFTLGFSVNSMSLEDGRLALDVDEGYHALSVTTEVLVRAAVVRTMTQLAGVKYVGITVNGDQLFDIHENPIGWMSADQFIDNDGNEINTYEPARVKLYFAGESGTELIAAIREKHYSTNIPLERFVVEELIAGPSGQVEGLYASVNPETKIVSVMTKDGICYVNLDENFLTVVGNVPTEVSIYAIVNSLVELKDINKVQILINGEVPPSFPASAFERNLDMVTTLKK